MLMKFNTSPTPPQRKGRKIARGWEGGRKERREAGSQEDEQHATTLMNLKRIMSGERSKNLPKNTQCMTPPM